MKLRCLIGWHRWRPRLTETELWQERPKPFDALHAVVPFCRDCGRAKDVWKNR